MSICTPRRGAALEDGVRENGNTAILALLSFAMLLVSLDQYIVVVALPEIGRDLGYSAHTLQSLVSAYAVASSGFLLFGGRSRELPSPSTLPALNFKNVCQLRSPCGLPQSRGLVVLVRGVSVQLACVPQLLAQ